MVDAIADGAPVAPIKDKMHALENRRVELAAMLEDVVEAPPLLHPSMAARYHEEVRDLIEALNKPDSRSEAADLIRTLIEKIELSYDEGEDRLVADLHGDLAGILAISTDRPSQSPTDEAEIAKQKALLAADQADRSALVGDRKVKLVAGAGFEPATFRL